MMRWVWPDQSVPGQQSTLPGTPQKHLTYTTCQHAGHANSCMTPTRLCCITVSRKTWNQIKTQTATPGRHPTLQTYKNQEPVHVLPDIHFLVDATREAGCCRLLTDAQAGNHKLQIYKQRNAQEQSSLRLLYSSMLHG
jgi:hypothetical protein